MKILLALVLNLSIMAGVLELNYQSFDKAMEASNKVSFYMESTKAGMITTSFEGVVKRGSLHYSFDRGTFKNIKLVVATGFLDTDNSARNDKMYEKCFQVEKYPQLIISIEEKLDLESKTAKGFIELLGKKHPIALDIKLEKSKHGYSIEGSSKLSLSGLNIPDPSIWIASVRDQVDVKFKFELRE